MEEFNRGSGSLLTRVAELGSSQSSILPRQHDCDHAPGDGWIGGIGRMHRQFAVEVIDVEIDHVTIGFVRAAKVVEHRDGPDDPFDGLGAERRHHGRRCHRGRLLRV
jgi:hypothetical protein